MARLRLRAAVAPCSGSKRRLGGQHLDGARLELHRHHRALLRARGERVGGDLLRLRDSVVRRSSPTLAGPSRRVDGADRARCGGRSAGRCSSPRGRAAAVQRRAADGVGEQRAGRVAAAEALLRAARGCAASTSPSSARITPRLISCSASSSRRLSGLSRSASASKTVHHDVKPTSTANSTSDEAEQAADRRVHRSPRRPARPAARARSETSSSSATQHEVGQDRRAAVGDERQRDAGERDRAS